MVTMDTLSHMSPNMIRMMFVNLLYKKLEKRLKGIVVLFFSLVSLFVMPPVCLFFPMFLLNLLCRTGIHIISIMLSLNLSI